MAIELLIIADDLTGAADTAVQFSKQGIRPALFLTTEVGFDRLDPAIKVVAVNTESRHLPQGEAFERVKSIAEKARRKGCRRFYKKIDSTFRGNVGAELDALMTAAGAPRLMLVPAYPAAGRTTRGGYQYVNGKPLHESAFSRDPLEPMAESFIPSILKKQTLRAVHLIDRNSVSGEGIGAESKSGILLFDAETDGDCAAIAGILDKSGELNLVAGAAGFAEILAGHYAGLYGRGYTGQFSSHKALSNPGPLFVVNGSLNDVSLGQVEQAKQEGAACFFVPPAAARNDSASTKSLVDTVVQCLKSEHCAVLTTAASGSGIIPAVHTENIGRTAAAVVRAVPAANVALFGGDTAAAVCRSLGYEVLYPRDEIMPGLTVCSAGKTTIGGAPDALIILKSGGFGSRDVIGKIRKYLRSR